ncbi:MAG: hypothetical protein MUC32_00180 [Burkholderiaceae bacterium]|nr:hypothetical protein [Burkholderiaceae bacterium]
MSETRWFVVETTPAGTTLRLHGAWRLRDLPAIDAALQGLALPAGTVIDASALGDFV